MERVSDSDLATNCGMEDRQATPATKVTMEDRACSSPTLLAVAIANKNKGGSGRAWKEAGDKGSKAGETKYVNTREKSPAGEAAHAPLKRVGRSLTDPESPDPKTRIEGENGTPQITLNGNHAGGNVRPLVYRSQYRKLATLTKVGREREWPLV